MADKDENNNNNSSTDDSGSSQRIPDTDSSQRSTIEKGGDSDGESLKK
jgi:hypothetical protein